MIRTKDLHKAFDVRVKSGRFRREKRVVEAVAGVSLEIGAGEMVGYIGPNGAGKSTTLKMLTGVLTPSGGEVEVCGLRPVPQRTKLALSIGVVFGQRSQLWWDLPLHESFALLRHIYRVPAAEHRERLRRCRELLDLDDFLDTPVRQLSLGQRVLFLDEPTIGLDVVSKQAVRSFLAELGATGDVTLVLTTHDLADIERLCERLVVIDHGRVVHDGTIEALHARYGSRRSLVADLSSPLPDGFELPGATLVGVEADRHRVTFALDGVAAGAAVAALVAAVPIRDLSVVEPDIEDVVARLYTATDPR
jgi:ABC-2 type transport system ATP-binding protein